MILGRGCSVFAIVWSLGFLDVGNSHCGLGYTVNLNFTPGNSSLCSLHVSVKAVEEIVCTQNSMVNGLNTYLSYRSTLGPEGAHVVVVSKHNAARCLYIEGHIWEVAVYSFSVVFLTEN